MILDAKSTDEIASTLNLSRKTAANYHYSIKSKLGVASDIELLYLGLQHGLVEVIAANGSMPAGSSDFSCTLADELIPLNDTGGHEPCTAALRQFSQAPWGNAPFFRLRKSLNLQTASADRT